MTNATPRKVTADGQSCHVPEDRHAYGMVDSYSVAHNLVLNTYYLPPFAKRATSTNVPSTAMPRNWSPSSTYAHPAC